MEGIGPRFGDVRFAGVQVRMRGEGAGSRDTGLKGRQEGAGPGRDEFRKKRTLVQQDKRGRKEKERTKGKEKVPPGAFHMPSLPPISCQQNAMKSSWFSERACY